MKVGNFLKNIKNKNIVIKRIAVIFVSILTIGMILINYGFEVNASQAIFSVHRIDDNGVFSKPLLTTTDFSEANKKMLSESEIKGNVVVASTDSLSPLKIISADRAYIHSYPYRIGNVGSVLSGEVTLTIYSNEALTSSSSYIAAHYKMKYIDTRLVNGKPVAKIEFQGLTGYVDISKTDIIPFVFVENGIDIHIGGNEIYYESVGKTKESPYTKLITADFYKVDYDPVKKINEVYAVYEQTINLSKGGKETRYGVAPKWLPVGIYYSSDGIVFYSDIDMKKPIYNGKEIGKYYSYFQWLPLRSTSSFTSDQITNDITRVGHKDSSVIIGAEQDFISYGKKYGMNPLLVYAQAALESGYGTSPIAKTKFNLFGVNAVDSNTGNATEYINVSQSIQQQMNWTLRHYLSQNDWRHAGYSYGNMSSGISVRYASDPYYGMKVASIAYTADKTNNFKEINKIQLGILKDNARTNIRKDPSTNNSPYFVSKAGRVNQFFSVHGAPVNKFYKTDVTQPIVNGEYFNSTGSVGTDYDLDLNKQFAYITQTNLDLVELHDTSPVSDQRGKIYSSERQYIVNTVDGLIFRSEASSGGQVVSKLPYGTVVEGELMNNGWIKATINNKVGYLSYTFMAPYKAGSVVNPPILDPNPVPKPDPKPEEKIIKGDINNDGKVTVIDLAMIKSHLEKIVVLKGDKEKLADLNGDGKITVIDLAMIKSHLEKIVILK